jgi:hypothetical protein
MTIALQDFFYGVQDPLAHARELPATSTHTLQKPRSSPHHLLGPTTHLLVDRMPTTLTHQCSCSCPCFDGPVQHHLCGQALDPFTSLSSLLCTVPPPLGHLPPSMPQRPPPTGPSPRPLSGPLAAPAEDHDHITNEGYNPIFAEYKDMAYIKPRSVCNLAKTNDVTLPAHPNGRKCCLAFHMQGSMCNAQCG